MFGEAISNKLERMPLERDVTTIGSHNLISNVACELNGMPWTKKPKLVGMKFLMHVGITNHVFKVKRVSNHNKKKPIKLRIESFLRTEFNMGHYCNSLKYPI